MFERLIHIDPTSHHSALILGPRGTGKTHWLRNHFENALYLDLLETETHHELLARPGLLEARIPKNHQDWIIIDEVQKIPALLNEVHRLIEHRGHRFLLTGSSARSLRKKGTNLLAGRALTYYLHPLVAAEMGDAFDWEHALTHGCLPSVYHTHDPLHYLQSYTQTYLKEEVQQEALTRNVALFARFLNVASFSQGEILSYSNLAKEIGTSRQTVSNFFDLLEDLLIAVRLPVFTKKAKRELIAHPKFYYFDSGIFRVLRPKGLLDTHSDIEGPCLETLFLQQCRALNDYFRWNYEFYYWRTRTQLEVDFVLYGEKGFHAFELKRKKNLSPQDFKGLKAFQDDYPMAQCTLIYGGQRSYHENGIRVVPAGTAFFELKNWLA